MYHSSSWTGAALLQAHIQLTACLLLTPQVCADTFRAGAFDQLKQNATKAQVGGAIGGARCADA